MVIPPEKPIVLLGFMGSGKSTLGKKLAEALSRIFTDLDRFIEVEENRTIPDIFEKEGESAFRKLESNALRRVLQYPGQVVAVGGGAPCFPGNLELIREKSLSLYLRVSHEQLLYRLAHSSTPRPLLKGKSESEKSQLIADLMAEREPYYIQADIVLESDEITLDMLIRAIQSHQ